MGNHIGKKSRPGVGTCETPVNGKPCGKKRVKGSLLCVKHRNAIRKSAEETAKDPRLMYNQRSDSPNRKAIEVQKKNGKKKDVVVKKRPPRIPTCCVIGCYQPRVPGEPFCYECQDKGMYD